MAAHPTPCNSTLSWGTAADHNNHASHADPALAVMYSTRVHHLRIRGHPSRLQSKRGTNTNHCQYPIAVNEIHSTNKKTKKSLISSTLFGDANGAIRIPKQG